LQSIIYKFTNSCQYRDYYHGRTFILIRKDSSLLLYSCLPGTERWKLTGSDPVLMVARYANFYPTKFAPRCSPLIEDQAKRIP